MTFTNTLIVSTSLIASALAAPLQLAEDAKNWMRLENERGTGCCRGQDGEKLPILAEGTYGTQRECRRACESASCCSGIEWSTDFKTCTLFGTGSPARSVSRESNTCKASTCQLAVGKYAAEEEDDVFELEAVGGGNGRGCCRDAEGGSSLVSFANIDLNGFVYEVAGADASLRTLRSKRVFKKVLRECRRLCEGESKCIAMEVNSYAPFARCEMYAEDNRPETIFASNKAAAHGLGCLKGRTRCLQRQCAGSDDIFLATGIMLK